VSDIPYADDYRIKDPVVFEIDTHADTLAKWEWVEERKHYREWLVPAAVLNRFARRRVLHSHNEYAVMALQNFLRTLTPAQQQVYVDAFADMFPEILAENTQISFADFQKKLTPAALQSIADGFVSYQNRLTTAPITTEPKILYACVKRSDIAELRELLSTFPNADKLAKSYAAKTAPRFVHKYHAKTRTAYFIADTDVTVDIVKVSEVTLEQTAMIAAKCRELDDRQFADFDTVITRALNG
jgi:hypothetical protein